MFLASKSRYLDVAVLLGYAAGVSTIVAHHEPWADEAQAWLVARDLPFWKMLFSQMRYENSPGLWHVILWTAQHVFHAPYPTMNWIGSVLATCGVAVLVFAAPFPRLVRYLIAFSYYVSYQYAVVARPYVMLLLFGGLAAVFYRRRQPIGFAIAIALLCGTSVHGAILAAALSLGAVWHLAIKRDWPLERMRARYLAASGIIVLAGIMLVAIVFPPADAGGESRFQHVEFGTLAGLLENTLVEPWIIAAILLAGLGIFASRNHETVPFVAGVGGVLAFEWLVYSLPQHMGAVVIALIVTLWIAWPKDNHWRPEHVMASLGLVVLFSIQTFWAAEAWRNDFSQPYSGSKDAAEYLRKVGADHARIFGFCYPMVAIQAYFNHSIFQNWPTSYLHDSKAEEENVCILDGKTTYDFVVTSVLHGDEDPYGGEIQKRGYMPIHVSPGRAFFRQGIWITETFVIYRRVIQ